MDITSSVTGSRRIIVRGERSNVPSAGMAETGLGMMLSIRKYGVACGVAVGELGVMVLDSVGGRVFIVGVGENVSEKCQSTWMGCHFGYLFLLSLIIIPCLTA
jgi:hypothetical protein